ncbi:MAG: AI-2E family transporter [Desulfomonilia bacterium]
MERIVVHKVILLLVVLFITAIFFAMIRYFLMAILLAGIFSGMFQPIYKRVERLLGGRKNLASLCTLIFILLILFIPLVGILGIVARQAIKISTSIKPWVEEWANRPSAFDDLFRSLPFHDWVQTHRSVILEKGGELVSNMSSILFENLSSATLSTMNFIFLFFVFFYTMFFFLKEGDLILRKILYYLPLAKGDEERMLDKFTSVTRATIKGTLVIGIIQGGLAGLAFWVVGIDSALFWGTIMSILSVIPALGSPIIWVPAVIILAVSGHYLKALALLAFCSILVGTIDNILRPWLVGRDTRMHELFIFFGTLGGIGLFGIAGFIIGPIIAALFVTVWEIYGETFKGYLPDEPDSASPP